MIFREMKVSEKETVYQMGYNEWAKGRNYEKYSYENEKEEKSGKRFVLIHNEAIIGSLILMHFQKESLIGIGSAVIVKEKRKLGYGSKMIQFCLKEIKELQKDPVVILYSDISPAFYEKLGFSILPDQYQKEKDSTCMFYSEKKIDWNEIKIPGYF